MHPFFMDTYELKIHSDKLDFEGRLVPDSVVERGGGEGRRELTLVQLLSFMFSFSKRKGTVESRVGFKGGDSGN